jgi:hypothetical protein
MTIQDNTIIRHTLPAVVRNTSGQKYLFINAAIKQNGSGAYSKTYTLERGKNVCVDPSDFIIMRLEIERLVAQGKISILRGVAGEIKQDDLYNEPNMKLNAPHCSDNCQDVSPEVVKPSLLLESRLNDPTNPEKNTMWLVDKGTGQEIGPDIDFRVRLGNKTYSVFDTVTTNQGVTIPIIMSNWILSGELWYQLLHHNLHASKVESEFYEGVNRIEVHKEEIFDTNTYKIYVPADPDLRFEGTAGFIKIA